MNSPQPSDSKLTARQLERQACIYIRQSTMKQVQTNRESQFNQYALVQRAEALGWSPARIRVFDGDLGQSGQSSVGRNDFQEMVSQVSLGQVGIILGYEVSRLARNNSDWYHLLDLAAIFGTLIADSDGIYDPRLYNDRLLLGLKGTLSEAELHLIRLRLDAGRLSKVRRGEYVQTLPTGLVRRPDGQVLKDPDEQVCHTLELLFAQFDELGSGPRLLRYLHDKHILLPRRQTGGLHKGELLWKRPTLSALYDILHNPAYAGAFVYGRRPTDPTRRKPGHRATGQVRKPMDEWLYLQRDVYPAFISWDKHLEIQARIHENDLRYDEQHALRRGAAREGAALLQGVSVCGHCGHQMRMVYKPSPRYVCFALSNEYGEKMCCSLDATSIDAVVVKAFFAAIQPAELDALEAVLAKQQAERAQLERHRQERVRRAQYDAQLARRQYDAVDPNNRLVAAELERRWEEQLQQLQLTQAEFASFQRTSSPPSLDPTLRSQLQHIAQKLPELWLCEQLDPPAKKMLLRSLIQRVILKRTAPDRIAVKIVWVSGHFSIEHVQPPIHRERDVTGYAQMVERIKALWAQGLNDEQIATQLTQEGFHSARSSVVITLTVRKVRLAHKWYRALHQNRNATELHGYLTAKGLAERIGVERSWVHRRLERGEIDPQFVNRDPVNGVYLIVNDEQLIERLRQSVGCRPHTNGGI